jgi:adenylate cyclase
VAFRVLRFRRFSTRLLLLLAGLIAVVQVAVYLLVAQANKSNATEHIEQSLQIGARIFQRTVRDRIDYLAGSAKVMSGDYAIKPLLMQDKPDKDTLRTVLLSYVDRVKAPVITLFSPDGDVLALTDEVLGAENVGPFSYLIRKATAADMEQASDFAYLGGRLHVLVVVPLYAPYPNVAAWFGLAYPIDAAFARSIKDITRLEVTFSSAEDGAQPRVLATTLNADMAATVARYGSAAAGPLNMPQTIRLGGEPYVSLFRPLSLLGDDPARITLQRSLTAELAPARELENVVLKISLAALAAATLAALWISRGISQPVQQLAEHTKHVAAGDYTRRLHLDRADELGQLAIAFNQMSAGLAERDRVRDLLGKVVSPEIAAQLLKSDLQLGGEEREVTILFSDLRDFTTLSERMTPAGLLALLNRYLDRMSGIVEKHGGVVDKYIGDAIMALFGAPVAVPDSAARALAAAREMSDALADLNTELAAEGVAPLIFGIGINTARVIAGNMGSKTRLNYTVIGDGVNLASRLEALTKNEAYRTSVIVSEATARSAGEHQVLRPLGSVTVKGKSEPVNILAVDIQTRPWPARGAQPS